MTRIISTMTGVLCFGFLNIASAHFQMIVPSDDMVKQREPRDISLDLMFWHPYEGFGMHMKTPAQFGVLADGKKTDLRDTLKPVKYRDINGDEFEGFNAQYSLRRPGDHIFYVEPVPYWEPSEQSFIVHYTKVIVNAFGFEHGWDEEVGLKTEIVPLTRPYGLYTGNVFQGIVKVNGKPAPYTEVEVEYYNKDGKLKPEADPMITQVVKADSSGVFTYAMPKARGLMPRPENTLIPPGYVYAEIGESLYVATKHKGFLDQALDFAIGEQHYQPWEAWAYAFEALHAASQQRRVRSAGIAEALDPQSDRLAQVGEDLRRNGRAWFEHAKPFAAKQPAKTSGTQRRI